MGAILRTIKMALANEDTLGKVLAGSGGKNIKQLIKESASVVNAEGVTSSLKGYARFNNLVNLTQDQVVNFDKAMNLASDVFSKNTVGKDLIKTLKADSKTLGAYNNKLVQLYEQASKGTLSKDKLIEIFGNKISGKADDIIAAVGKSTGKEAAEEVAKSSVKGLPGKIGKFLKGKGGSVAILLSVVFELPEIIKGFKNGDGVQQIGRSALNIGGFAAGAAAGAAIGSVIPLAGTLVGGLIGGLCGIVGGMAGGAISDKLGKAIFGESIASKKEKAAEQQQAMAEMQNSGQVQQSEVAAVSQPQTQAYPASTFSTANIPPLEEMLALANQNAMLKNNTSLNTFA